MVNSIPFISIKVTNRDGKTVETLGSRRTRRVFRFIQREKSPDELFEVSVTYSNGMTNATPPQSREKTIRTLQVFLEK